jgi:predicted esterase YcpF (UPF0227 family)
MILNIHGFGSNGNNSKAKWLQSVFGEERVLSPDLEFSPLDNLEYLRDLCSEKRPELIVGSSLGGFFSYCLCADFDIPCMILNPALLPFLSLQDRIGSNTNPINGKSVTVTCTQLRQLAELFHRYWMRTKPEFVNIFVCKDDELIPHKHLTRKFRPFVNQYVEFPKGTHRFRELDRLTPYVKELISRT